MPDREDADWVGRKETFRPTIEDVDDVNEATKQFHSILNEIREEGGRVTVQVAVVEVDD